jgi:DNA-binding SARP family transcriptional activator
MATTTNFTVIYDYFYSHCTDEDKKAVNTDKCKQFLKAVFSEYITHVDSDASINYTTELITTSETMTEIQKNLLSLMMYREYASTQVKKYSKLTSIIADSHRISDVSSVKRTLKEIFDETETKINNYLATLL